MHRITIYVANDGTRFEGLDALARCQAYEQTAEELPFKVLEQYIKFFDWGGNPLRYSQIGCDAYSIDYARVLGIPDERKDPDAFQAWERIVPPELHDEICSYGCGWYMGDGRGNFEAWEQIVEDYTAQANLIEKLSEGN